MVFMSPQVFEFPVLRSLGLSVGVAFLLSNASAMALPLTPSSTFSISQVDSSKPPVVVDTEPVVTGTSTTPTSNGGLSYPTGNSQARFSCQSLNGKYTVVYQPESQPNQYFPWATPSALGGGWDSQRRCDEISRRLESYRPDGLVELSTDVENNYNTVCVTTEQVPGCRIVFTVPPGQDPLTTRDRVFQNIITADSGQQTIAVNTYRNRQTNGVGELVNLGQSIFGGGKKRQATSRNIDLRPFLDRADGGTGTKLRGGVSKASNSQLNPGNFRLTPGSFR